MKKPALIQIICVICVLPAFAETNALIEVKLFKDWVIKGEANFGHFNLAIKNTGTAPFLLANGATDFEIGQLSLSKNDRHSGSLREQFYNLIAETNSGYQGFFSLPPGETHVYEGRKFYLNEEIPFSDEMRFTVSVYLGKGFWLDSESVTLKGVVPDSIEHVATHPSEYGSRDLVAVTYKNERWLYSKSASYFQICPISLTNKIRVEPHDGKSLHKIWDGDKSMTYRLGNSILTEGPDENNVFGKWTRERKQKAEADNAEVRRKKAEQ